MRSTAPGRAVSPARLTITVQHTCAEDLGISLIAPDGTAYGVKSSGGFTCTRWNGRRTYQVPVTGNAAGTWQLHITDYGPGDTGTLDSWSLTV
ncbi:proprotein convertase P-domain-containing protein [Micromonosporaceae bacterium Da 78-11]